MNYDEYGDPLGYANPPRSTRYKTGQSGNPKGRPPGRKKEIPYEAVLGQMVRIRENGVERQVTAAEAFLLRLAKQGLEGDGAAARAILNTMEKAQTNGAGDNDDIATTIIVIESFDSCEYRAMIALRMARKMDQYRPTA